MNDGNIIGELLRSDAAPAFELARRTGVHGGVDFVEWQSFKDWAVWHNPYSTGFCSGITLRHDKNLVGFADYVYVPFFVDDWEGIACNLGSICLEPALGGIEGLKFVRQCAKRAPTSMHYASHLNKQLAGIWRRMKASQGIGSEITHQLTISFPGRVMRRLQRTPFGRCATIHKAISLLLEPIDLIGAKARRILGQASNYSVVRPETLEDEWLNDIWVSARDDATMGIIRNASYLRWRYQTHPRASCFHWIVVGDRECNGLPVALIIIDLINESGLARINEIICPKGHRAQDALVVRAAVDAARSLGAIVLQTKPVSSRWATRWAEYGFQVNTRPYSSWMYFDRRAGALDSEHTLWFTYGDFKPM